MTVAVAALLLVWSVVVTMDLATFPQGLLSRPLIAGTVGGLITGDPLAGMMAGAVLELYALDVMPVGAARYPDHGAAAVAASAAASLSPGMPPLAAAGLLGLPLAVLGGWTLHLHRRANTRRSAASVAALASGDPRAVSRLHWAGVAGELVRGAVMGSAVLLAVFASMQVEWAALPHLEWASAATAAGAMVAVIGGLVRGAGTLRRGRLVVAGLAIGMLIVIAGGMP